MKDAEEADEESRLLNMMEKLDLEDEKKKDREAEEEEVQEVPVTRKKPKKKKRRKSSAKSRHSSLKNRIKLFQKLSQKHRVLKNFFEYRQKSHNYGWHNYGGYLYFQKTFKIIPL